ncbi:g4123 [Coccomyxa viridis]|uniref:G4123 protein n=1 Tax=Coccomyxa viridis TaxID=1274662 RepID=A0ABP1FWL8_9CHLO
MAGSMSRFVLAALLVTIIAVTASGAPRDALRSFSQAREGADEQGWSVLTYARSLSTEPDTPWRWTPTNIAAICLACLCALLANSAGIGGGPFYIPLLTVVLGFDLKAATGLSHTIVATSAVASTVYGLIQTHPKDPTRPLVDFDLALTFIPALLLGVSFGVLFNVLFPDWLQTALLTILLLFVINKTVRKGIRQWNQESKAIKQRHEDAEEEEEHGDEQEKEGVLHEETFHRNPSLKLPEHPSRLQMAERTASHIWHRLPLLQIVEVVVLWVIFLATQQLKSRYGNCTWQYFVIFIVQVLFLLGVTTYCVWHQSKRAAASDSDNMDPELRVVMLGGQENDGSSGPRKKPYRKLAMVVAVMAFAGFTAGLLGIGGALIFNPVLLQLGVQPQVTASTSVLMILFSSSAIALSFYFQGLLNVSYAQVIAPLCFAASLIGVLVVGRIIRKTGRASIIVLILSALITIGTVLTAVFGGIRAANNIKNGGSAGFKPFCE